MGRKRFNEREILETLSYQAPAPIPCFRCGAALLDGRPIEREHLHELKLGGPDIPANCRYSHKVCHAVVTNGNGATTAGSSANRIAKTKGTRVEKFIPKKLSIDQPREQKRRWSSFRSRP